MDAIVDFEKNTQNTRKRYKSQKGKHDNTCGRTQVRRGRGGEHNWGSLSQSAPNHSWAKELGKKRTGKGFEKGRGKGGDGKGGRRQVTGAVL